MSWAHLQLDSGFSDSNLNQPSQASAAILLGCTEHSSCSLHFHADVLCGIWDMQAHLITTRGMGIGLVTIRLSLFDLHDGACCREFHLLMALAATASIFSLHYAMPQPLPRYL